MISAWNQIAGLNLGVEQILHPSESMASPSLININTWPSATVENRVPHHKIWLVHLEIVVLLYAVTFQIPLHRWHFFILVWHPRPNLLDF